MQWLVAVDPGLPGCGVAIFKDGQLHWADWVTAAGTGNGPQRWIPVCSRVVEAVRQVTGLHEIEIVIEFPRLRAAGRQVGAGHSVDPDDIVQLAGFVGCLSGVCAVQLTGKVPVNVRPEEWKGGLPKDICHERVLQRLTTVEIHENMLLTMSKVRRSALHNVLDAVGIGLWRLGRLKGNVNGKASCNGPGEG